MDRDKKRIVQLAEFTYELLHMTPERSMEDAIIQLGGRILEISDEKKIAELGCDAQVSKLPGSDKGFQIQIVPGLSKERRRFLLAHELGHFVCHMLSQDSNGKTYIKDQCYSMDESSTLQEQEADVFAIAFMMPSDVMRGYVEQLKEEKGDVLDVKDIATYFGVSIQTAFKRGIELDLW